jgi:hypothetical protein
MTQDEIIDMAIEVYGSVHADDIKFAKLVAAKEREACAKVAMEFRRGAGDAVCGEVATAIRNRGKA